MKIENRQKFLVILTAIAAGLFIGNSVIYEPMAKWWTTRQDTIHNLEAQVKKGKDTKAMETSLRNRWNEMQTNTLPINTSEAEQKLGRELDRWARARGATIDSTGLQWKNDTDDYMTLNWRVEASGNLRVLTDFLYDIERDPMALKLESVELSANDNTGQTLRMALQISALVLNPQAKR